MKIIGTAKEKMRHSAFSHDNVYLTTNRGILYQGDCLEVLPKISDESIDFIITDPPYGVNSDDRWGFDYKDDFYPIENVATQLYRVLKDNARAFVFTAQKTFTMVVEAFEKAGFSLHQTLIWFRPNLAGGTKKKLYDFTSVYEQILNFHKGKPERVKKVEGYNNFDVLKYSQPQTNFKRDKRYHIHQKPLELCKHVILACSRENQVVLDPFMGSGTVAVACEQANRCWMGVEINPKYCEIVKKRLTLLKTRSV